MIQDHEITSCTWEIAHFSGRVTHDLAPGICRKYAQSFRVPSIDPGCSANRMTVSSECLAEVPCRFRGCGGSAPTPSRTQRRVTMRKKLLAVLAPAALLALPLAAPAAMAQDGETYQAELAPLNGSGASGNLMLELNGEEATITANVSGLATTFMDNPYPHVQHIHIAGQGQCPDMSADENGDGIVDTVEGQPAYGMIGTTLSTSGDTSAEAGTNVEIAPSGGSYEYSRTFDLNADTLESVQNGTAVIVVHGLDPTTLSEEAANAKSNLVPELPLAATAPALCGTLAGSQMTQMPEGSVDTGAGSTSGMEDAWLIGAGGAALIAAAGGAFLLRRRTDGQR
jgi:hypothetical protein